MYGRFFRQRGPSRLRRTRRGRRCWCTVATGGTGHLRCGRISVRRYQGSRSPPKSYVRQQPRAAFVKDSYTLPLYFSFAPRCSFMVSLCMLPLDLTSFSIEGLLVGSDAAGPLLSNDGRLPGTLAPVSAIMVGHFEACWLSYCFLSCRTPVVLNCSLKSSGG